MTIYPAIDLRGGRVVRLTEGDYGNMQVYGDDPVAVAKGFAAQGATHLHVVDLDGAKAGQPQHAALIGRIARESGLFTQTGGGLRSGESVRAVLLGGASRAILGTAALADPAFLRRMLDAHGDRIAVGVDVREGKVATHGWLADSGRDAMDFCRELLQLGVQTVIYTDIARDGRLMGPNLAAYHTLAALAGLCVIASGGVTSRADVLALRDAGASGAIIGKALYEGRLTLPEALGAAGEEASG